MHALADIEDDLAGLGRLAERDLGLAMRYADRIEALGEDEDDRAVALARPYQAMARSYRQTLAMKARMRRELDLSQRAERHRATVAAAPRPAAFVRLDRMAALETAVRPLIWSEYEGAEAEALDEELGEIVGDLYAEPGFEDLPLDAQVARAAELLGLGEAAPADDPAPEGPPPSGEVDRRASAETEGVRSEAAAAPDPTAGEAPLSRCATAPPTGEQPAPAAPPPEPWPEPYIPPWEKLRPGQIMYGGSGW